MHDSRIRVTMPVWFATLGLFACGSGSADASRDTGAIDPSSSDGTDGAAGGSPLPKFSFFVVSYKSITALANNTNGFGGDLRFGETGPGAGLRGADKICATVAERSMAGSSAKQWRAFLSVTADENGHQVDAIDRVGEGPWYDRIGRTVALTKADLLGERPANIGTAIQFDLPNEDGVPNHNPDKTGEVDNHDMLTGSNARGQLYSATATCKDWTVADGAATNGQPRVGHSWPTSGQLGCSDTSSGGDASLGGGGPAMGGGLPGMDGGIPWVDGLIPGMDGDVPWTDGVVPWMDGGIPAMGDLGPWTDGLVPSMDGGPSLGGADPSVGGGDGSMCNWISSLDEAGCGAGVNLKETGGPAGDGKVGSGGGYGGFYCFALTP
jgi:hypothetical protein